MYQRAYFPMNRVSLSQGYGLLSYSHQHTKALDLGGNQKLFAPFDCVVKKVYVPKKKDGSLDTSHAFEVWLTSLKKVLCPNGYYGKLTVAITHPKGIAKMKVGKEYKQYEDLGLDTSDMTGKYDGNHAHLEVGKGIQSGWDATILKKYKKYVIKNAVPPQDYLFVSPNALIGNEKYRGKKYDFIKEKDITYKVVGVPNEPLLIREEETEKAIGKLYNGNEVLKFDNNKRCKVYHYNVIGLTYKKYLKK